ncbi:hypothetical protein HPB50_003174 [Hyalomma asiaticum]|uniref:Uncharacterized protein n=1 Tax=Hyalomma asiaticum TaxID=266040 RepID=A0ACB7RTZ0_HYAAI|nr:hypothetical protein HPB50_003174 [Hyalomma asiaticum]
MRHATSAKHVENARKHRDKDGVLTKSRCTQSTLDFSRNAPTTSLQESVAKAEALFALTVVANSLPYTLADVATATYPHMFPDSQIAKAFQCGRKKVSYIISDGLGPYFKGKVVEELAEPGVFYTVMIDETPVPEMKVQQLDVLVRYFSVKAQDVVVEHLQSFHMGHATADELFSCVSDSLSELPKNNMVCFFSDGPNVMKCLKRKIKAELSPNMIDIGECGLHKVHNAFAAALDTFCQEVDSIVTDIHQYFKCATRHADIKDLQQKLGLPQLEFLRHVSSRWLTLLPSIQRVLELYDALKAFFSKSGEPKTSYVRHNRLAAAFADHTLRARLLFLKNAAQLFDRFQTLFQSKKPLIHVFYEEMVAIVKLVMGRFLRQEAFKDATGFQLKDTNVELPANWKAKPELGSDTEKEMELWTPTQKKAFHVKARAFYITCTKYLVSRLPLDNRVLFHMRFLKPGATGDSYTKSVRFIANALPQVIPPNEVSTLTDEWLSLVCETADWEISDDVIPHWANVFLVKMPNGEPKYPKLAKLAKAVLCLPHGNADCERGFSENKQALHHRASLSITSVTSFRQTKAFLKRYGGDATKVPLTNELLRSVGKSYRAHRERVQREEASASRKRKSEELLAKDCEVKKLKEEKTGLQARLTSLKSLLASAQDLINLGVSSKDMQKVETGNVLLTDVNSKLPSVLERIQAVDAALEALKSK